MLPAPGDYYDEPHEQQPGPGALVLSSQSENYRDYAYQQQQQQQQQQNLSRGNSGGANGGFTQHRNSSYNNVAETRREPNYQSQRQTMYQQVNGSGSRADLMQGGGGYDSHQQQPVTGGGDWDLTRELMAVSEEMKRIELGPGRGTARRRY